MPRSRSSFALIRSSVVAVAVKFSPPSMAMSLSLPGRVIVTQHGKTQKVSKKDPAAPLGRHPTTADGGEKAGRHRRARGRGGGAVCAAAAGGSRGPRGGRGD